MPQPRRARKIDDNQQDIVKALRQIPGVTVEVDHDDILVGVAGVNYWFEIKRPESVSKRTGQIKQSEITESEQKRLRTWQGSYAIVWNLDQILRHIGL